MKPVTGPDGDNPITDAQILELRRTPIAITHPDALKMRKLTGCALGEAECGDPDEDGNARDPDENEIEDARARCADAFNARFGAGE